MANSSRSSQGPARVVLEGVPHGGFYEGGERCPEDVPFPSCLRACLEFMGENLGCEHSVGVESEPSGYFRKRDGFKDTADHINGR